MKKLMTLVAAGMLALTPVLAQADDHADHAADAAVEVEADVAVDAPAADAAAPTVVVEGDAVYVVDAEGNKSPAPDGTHTLADGTTVTTSGGMKVDAAAE